MTDGLRCSKADDAQKVAGPKAERGESRTQAAQRARSHSEEQGKWLSAGGRGTLPLLRGSHELSGPGAPPVSVPCGLALVSRAVAAQPEQSPQLGPYTARLIACWLPVTRIHHPYPLHRLGVIT